MLLGLGTLDCFHLKIAFQKRVETCCKKTINAYDCTCLKRLMLAEHVWMLPEALPLVNTKFRLIWWSSDSSDSSDWLRFFDSCIDSKLWSQLKGEETEPGQPAASGV